MTSKKMTEFLRSMLLKVLLTPDDFILDPTTGEAICHLYEEGIYYSKEQMAVYKARKDQIKMANQQLIYKDMWRRAAGNFIWINYNFDKPFFEDINDATLARFMVAASFADYHLVLQEYHKKPMSLGVLQEKLHLSDKTFDKFIKEVKAKKLLKVVKDNEIIITCPNIMRGQAVRENQGLIRLYTGGIQTIYEQLGVRSHCKLGHILRMIPYVNYKYNVLCYNPQEPYLPKIRAVSFAFWSEKCGLTAHDANKLVDSLREIRIGNVPVVICRDEPLVNGILVEINPLLFFGGNLPIEYGRYRNIEN
ncbi:MAG: hypothetical protein VB064_01285 [Oscillospiraceae bacterium]|nr:hypothetical protein [Oscillospiraceae bacterium]